MKINITCKIHNYLNMQVITEIYGRVGDQVHLKDETTTIILWSPKTHTFEHTHTHIQTHTFNLPCAETWL